MTVHPFDVLIEPAIRLSISELLPEGPTEEDFDTVVKGFAKELGEKGDILLWGGKRKKDKEKQRELFVRLARTVAIMSFCPGGIDFAGVHYDSEIAP